MADETYSDAVASLLEIGVPQYEWPDYAALYGLTAEHIPELIRMATDESTMEEDSSSLSVFSNIHAWRALGQLRAVEAAPALVGLFGWIDKYDDEWADDDLPEAVALIG